MSSAEFERALAVLWPDAKGKGQGEATRFLNIAPRTVRNYAAKGAPDPVAKFLRYMIAAGVSPADVDAALARKSTGARATRSRGSAAKRTPERN